MQVSKEPKLTKQFPCFLTFVQNLRQVPETIGIQVYCFLYFNRDINGRVYFYSTTLLWPPRQAELFYAILVKRTLVCAKLHNHMVTGDKYYIVASICVINYIFTVRNILFLPTFDFNEQCLVLWRLCSTTYTQSIKHRYTRSTIG